MRFRKVWLASLLAYLSGWPFVQAAYNRLFGAWKRREMQRPHGEYQTHLRAQARVIVDEMQARRRPRQRWWSTEDVMRERMQHLGARLDARLRAGVYVVCDGPPGPESGRFVEVEDQDGRGLGPGDTGAEWSQRDDGYWVLGPFHG